MIFSHPEIRNKFLKCEKKPRVLEQLELPLNEEARNILRMWLLCLRYFYVFVAFMAGSVLCRILCSVLTVAMVGFDSRRLKGNLNYNLGKRF